MKNDYTWIIIFHLLHSIKNLKLEYNWCSKDQKCRLHLLIKIGKCKINYQAADYYDLN